MTGFDETAHILLHVFTTNPTDEQSALELHAVCTGIGLTIENMNKNNNNEPYGIKHETPMNRLEWQKQHYQ